MVKGEKWWKAATFDPAKQGKGRIAVSMQTNGCIHDTRGDPPTPKLYIKIMPLFYFTQDCYVEPHATAFTHCMLCINIHEVSDAPALQPNQSSSLSTASHKHLDCLVKFAPPLSYRTQEKEWSPMAGHLCWS